MKKFLPSFLINNIPAGPGISIHTRAMGAAWLRVPLNLIWRLIPRNEHGRCTRLAPPARSFDALAFLPLPPLQQVAISCQKPNQFSQKLRSFCGNYQKQGRLTWIWTGQKETEKGPEKMFCRAYINTNGMSNTPCWQDHDTCLQFYKPAVGLWIFHHWTELSCYQDKSWNLIATLHWYSFVLVCLHNQCWPRLPKGPYIKDIHKIFGFFDPLPPCPNFG